MGEAELDIIAVDPGKTTGLAFWCIHENDFRSWERDDPMEAVSEIRQRIYSTPTEVVCENFIPRPGVRTWQPDALHIIGALRWLTWHGSIPFTLQMPAEAKRFVDDARLKKAGFHTRGKGHANDAARHLLLALVKRGLISTEEL